MSVAKLSLAAIHAALRSTTETLAHELARPSLIAPDWSEGEWLVARATASIHGVSALLAERLIWKGPAGWRQFLTDQRVHTTKRCERIEELLEDVRSRARTKGIALVALKGAALHAAGCYLRGERPMADIDLLSSADQERGAGRLLEELGFQEWYATWKHRVFKPRDSNAPATLGEHAESPIYIELHTRVVEILPRRPVDITGLMFAQRLDAGLNEYPSRSALLLHVLLHASGAMIFRGVRMIHLQDVARVCERMTDADWQRFFRDGEATADPTLWWTYPLLALSHRYYLCVPQAVLARTGADCHWLLNRLSRRRTLSDVSLSYLWISAFPGIEWARSVREMLAHGAARVRPSQETRQLRELYATVQPRVSGGSWAQLSQGRRLLRWLTARQARNESIVPVRAALACADPAGAPTVEGMLRH
jgi:hypothetical protein